MDEADCGFLELDCAVDEWVNSAVGDAIENMANAVLEAFGTAVGSLGTLWVNVGTPNLTGSGGETSTISAGSSAPGSEGIVTILGYVTWISFTIAALSIVILGAMIATRIRNGEGVAAVGRIGLILGAVILMGGATGFVSGLLPSGPQGAGGAVFFLQSSLWWYMGAAAVVSIVIGGAKMVWEQRAEPGRETIKSLLTLIVVAGSGVTIVGLLVSAFDQFSIWIINGSLDCDVAGDGACFGGNIAALLALTTNPQAGGLGALLIIILGLIAILAAAFQIVLMVARGGMLVILTGILPLSAAATNTEMGKSWFNKNVGWLIAFILYKPAAAIVYATAFQLTGTDVFKDDGTGLLAVLTGLMLMVLALFAMPALMRFVTPLVGSMAAGAGGALALGALAALPSGAAALGRLSSGSGGGGGGGDGDDSGGGSGSPSGSTGAQQSSTPSADASGSSGAASSSGATSAGTGAGAAAAGGGAGGGASAGGGAAAGGAAAGGGAAAAAGGGSAAGAAGGPIGIAAGAAIGAAKTAGDAAKGAAQDVGNQATGEGSDN
ncbi:hypothetical protein [Cryobacterium melibiosiphilum]|uniref:hypothetical protein n=1 Tax=Cryobacterium melibiosiphilum TaxID=995039 RepID=UPI0018F659E7|nr:hypothetical protein [Cryobacterium melibiosiphilum]